MKLRFVLFTSVCISDGYTYYNPLFDEPFSISTIKWSINHVNYQIELDHWKDRKDISCFCCCCCCCCRNWRIIHTRVYNNAISHYRNIILYCIVSVDRNIIRNDSFTRMLPILKIAKLFMSIGFRFMRIIPVHK